MLISGIPTIDPKSVRPYYLERGLSTKLLDKCNIQEFRFIDGAGLGHFLVGQTITTETVNFNVDSRNINLKVIRSLSLEHTGHSGGIRLLVTAEPKYNLRETVVGRNYNVTIDKSLNTYGATTIHTVAPDLVPKTMDEVIEDFLPGGYTLNWFADSILSFDINLEGIDVMRAIDKICSIYGLVWTTDGTDVYVWDLDPGTPSSGEVIAGLPEPINDIRHSISDDVSDYNVSFPIYDYCRKEPSEYYTKNTASTTQGMVINVMDPWYPAVVDSLGALRNQALLDTRASLITTNMGAIHELTDYVVKHKYYCPSLGTTPICLSEIHGDLGSGRRSIFRHIPYPVQLTRFPPSKARYADRWIGELTDGYWGKVTNFVVTPLFGLDGRNPPGDQLVDNIYLWDYGAPGATIGIEWDCNNERWIPFQQEYICPPDEDPNYPESPTVPPYPLPPE